MSEKKYNVSSVLAPTVLLLGMFTETWWLVALAALYAVIYVVTGVTLVWVRTETTVEKCATEPPTTTTRSPCTTTTSPTSTGI